MTPPEKRGIYSGLDWAAFPQPPSGLSARGAAGKNICFHVEKGLEKQLST